MITAVHRISRDLPSTALRSHAARCTAHNDLIHARAVPAFSVGKSHSSVRACDVLQQHAALREKPRSKTQTHKNVLIAAQRVLTQDHMER